MPLFSATAAQRSTGIYPCHPTSCRAGHWSPATPRRASALDIEAILDADLQATGAIEYYRAEKPTSDDEA